MSRAAVHDPLSPHDPDKVERHWWSNNKVVLHTTSVAGFRIFKQY